MRSLLVKAIGFPATVIHGDPLVADRWLWLRKRLGTATHFEKLIDIGCGSGAFTIGAALRGYDALGLSWDKRNQSVAAERALICRASTARFEVLDVRHLDERHDLRGQFDVAICCEVIEHILDDAKLMKDISNCLRPGGRLFLTTPSLNYRSITRDDDGPFLPVENGGHVRKGYTAEKLKELCEASGLVFENSSFCGGFLSQKLTFLFRVLSRIHPLFASAFILPLRPVPPILDGVVTNSSGWPGYSICLEAIKAAQ